MQNKKNLSTVLVVIILIGAFLVLRAAIVGQLSTNIKDADFEEDALKAAAGCVPPSLSNIRVENITTTGAVVKWTTNQQSTSSVRLGTTSNSMSWLPTLDTPASTAGVTTHSYVLSNLQAAKKYYYRVRSSNTACQKTSVTYNFTTLSGSTGTPDITAPTTPASVSSANVTSSGFTLRWNGSTDPVVTGALSSGVKGYEVYGPNSACFVNGSAGYCGNVLHTSTGQHSLQITGLTASRTYSGNTGQNAGFTIKAYDNANNYSAGTPRLSVTTLPPTTTDVCPNLTGVQATVPTGMIIDASGNCVVPPDTTAPTAPTALMMTTKTSDSIGITWTAATDNVGVVGYRVYVNSESTPVNATLITGTTYIISGLSPSSVYQITVKAFDAAGNSSTFSNSISVTTDSVVTVDLTAPTRPTGLTATGITSSGFTLNWAASTDDTLSASQINYDVYGSTQACNVSGIVGYCGAVTGTTSMTISGLSSGTTFNAATGANAGFVVQAYDNALHYSLGSVMLPVTTLVGADTTAPVISNVQVNATATNATITWTTNEASNTYVEFGPTTSYGLNASNASMVTSHSQVITGLTSGNTYNYRVKSTDAAGNTATSANYSFTATFSGGGGSCSTTVPLRDQRQMWVWHDTTSMIIPGNAAQTNLFNYVDAKNIDMIYMSFSTSQLNSNATRIKAFLNTAWNDHCVQVQFLDGRPEWVTDHNAAVAWVNAAKAIDVSIPAGGVHPYGLNVDVENYSSLSSSSGRASYISMYNAMKAAAAGTNMKIVGVAPRWYDTSDGISTNASVRMQFMRDFIDAVDEVGLMNYVVTASSFYNDASNELAYAASVGKQVVLGVETIDLSPWNGDNGPTSFYGKTCNEMNTMINASYALIPASVMSGFGGFAIHDFYQVAPHLGGWQPLCP